MPLQADSLGRMRFRERRLARQRIERRLAAILIAGYGRLMGADEEGTLAQLDTHRRELIEPKISEHRGRIVKTTGDGLLIEFPSVIEAVCCALAVQRGMVERNAGTPEEYRITFRIGVNLGDIIGDGVNIAARLEGIAEPGGICISEDAFRQVRGKADAEFRDIGEQTLKTYCVLLKTSEARTQTLPLPDKPSIAVLPFANLSGDPEQEYFADGIVDDIITGLSQIRWLLVIGRNSSFAYKGRSVDVKRIGRELGVRYALEGSVRRSGNRIRITTQLIEAEIGIHVWAERYDHPLNDIFAVQDEVTLSTIGAIEPSLRTAEIERVKRKRPENLDAYDLVLRALPSANAAMPKPAGIAVPLLERALALEPAYGLAHGYFAFCFVVIFARGGSTLRLQRIRAPCSCSDRARPR
jgi:adenylate cyclase